MAYVLSHPSTGMVVNLYSSNQTSPVTNGTRLLLYSWQNNNDQKWTIEAVGNPVILRLARDSSKVLNRHSSNNNAHVWYYDGSAATKLDSLIDTETTNGNTRIKLVTRVLPNQGKSKPAGSTDNNWEMGNCLFVNHANPNPNVIDVNGISSNRPYMRAQYQHLDSYVVSLNQNVTKGQVIGYMGYTGLTDPMNNYGTHLHLGIRICATQMNNSYAPAGAVWADPMKILPPI